MTYLVMECHPSYAIVLDNEGRMIKAANLGYQEGQVVGEIIARQTPKAPILFRLAPLAAAACLCLAVLGGGAYGAYGMPYDEVSGYSEPSESEHAVWYSGGENQSGCENVCELYGSRSWPGRCE